mgnify:CR=1 FL=1
MKNVIKTLVVALKEFAAIIKTSAHAARLYKTQQDLAKVRKTILEA